MFAELASRELPWASFRIYQVDERVAADGTPSATSPTCSRSWDASRQPCCPCRSQIPTEASAAAHASRLPARFDLAHLGVGADGHTASLVPGDPVLEVTDRLVAIIRPYQGYRRMTLTCPALARGDETLWLVSGANKHEALGQLWAGDPSIPAARVRARRSVIFADAHAVHGPARQARDTTAADRPGPPRRVMTASHIRMVLADVDGILVTSEKKLTDRAIKAVHRLYDARIRFVITSGRPPRGMAMFVEPLALQTAIAPFNGGVIAAPGYDRHRTAHHPRDW